MTIVKDSLGRPVCAPAVSAGIRLRRIFAARELFDAALMSNDAERIAHAKTVLHAATRLAIR